MRAWLSRGALAAVAATALTASVAAQTLPAPVESAWRAYLAAAEDRLVRERGRPIPRRAGVERGEIVIEQVSTPGPGGPLSVPGAAVHHWRGTVLVPGAQVADVMDRLEREPPDTRQEDVVSSSILEARPGRIRVAIRVRRSLIMSAVFDTEHEVHFARVDGAHAASWSTATRIVEIADAGTPDERPKPENQDRDLLWRWNAYWRYEQAPQGVLVECESITLSRTVPLLLRPVAGPLVNHVARESMDRTLAVLRERFRKGESK
jgi:hypothetical protein